jgi:hypothetical protein
VLQTLKTCKKCDCPKPLDAFPFSTKYRVGRAPTCRACKTAVARAWRAVNRDRYNEGQRRQRAANPEKYRGYVRAYAERNPNGRRERQEERRARNPKIAWAKNALVSSRLRAAEHGVPHSLTLDDIYAMCVDVCPVLNVALEYPVKMTPGKSGGRPNSPSLDRFKGELGYVTGNVSVIAWQANSIKTNATVDEVEAVARWMRARL